MRSWRRGRQPLTLPAMRERGVLRRRFAVLSAQELKDSVVRFHVWAASKGRRGFCGEIRLELRRRPRWGQSRTAGNN